MIAATMINLLRERPLLFACDGMSNARNGCGTEFSTEVSPRRTVAGLQYFMLGGLGSNQRRSG